MDRRNLVLVAVVVIILGVSACARAAGIRGKPAEDVWVRWNEILTK